MSDGYLTGKGELLWALDLAPAYPGGLDQPAGAHLIVRVEPGRYGEVRTCECGQTFTAGTHPRGWWSTRPGILPLQEHAVRCGKITAKEPA